MKSQKNAGSSTCRVRLDRLFLGADGRGASIKKIQGFRCSEGHRLPPGQRLATYRRMKRFLSETTSSQIVLRYQKAAPWLPTWRIEITGDDRTGITPAELEAALSQCTAHKVSVVELAFDFARESGVDRNFVLQHGVFGKSRRRTDRGGPGQVRYGSRHSSKLVRCYWKNELSRFRVELEVHSALLRKCSVFNVTDFGTLCPRLLRSHIRFVGFRWRSLGAHLAKKVGRLDGEVLLEATQKRAGFSLRRAIHFLSRNGVTNPHRFLHALRINDEVELALRAWHARFSCEDGG